MAVNLTSRNIARLAGKFVVVEASDMSVALGTLAIEGDEAVVRTGLRGRPIRTHASDVERIVLAEKFEDAVVIPAIVPVSLVKA